MENFAAQRTKMVDSQLRTESVTDHRLLAAMGEIPRELFVPADQRPLAYIDRDIPLKEAGPGGRAMMEPAPLARLIQALDVGEDERALVIGAGTGYSAAILGRLAGAVVALESDPALAAQATRTLAEIGARNVTIVVGPLESGHPAGAPYDVILLDGAIETLPVGLLDQLADGGRLAAVVGYGRAATATLYTRSGDDIGDRPIFDADVPPLPGFRNPEAFVF
jgi:protein-L-isoaspartate(D-aspartate) O-methyltransferase